MTDRSVPPELVVDFDIHDDGLTPKVYERYADLRRRMLSVETRTGGASTSSASTTR